MILEFPAELDHLQKSAIGITIGSILDTTCDQSFLDELDDFVRLANTRPGAYFGYLLPSRIASRLPQGDAWLELCRYCEHRLGNMWFIAPILLETLIYIFEPSEVGAWIAPNVLRRLEPTLEFDDDGLLVGPREALRFTKEGVLTQAHWFLYERLPGAGISGAFVEDLLAVVAGLGEEVTHLGLSVKRDAVLAAEHHRLLLTQAYLRGPRDISADRLDDPRFPEEPRGTVTEHRRVCENPLFALFPVERLEVMWSSRDGVKTVQIEELVTADSIRASSESGVSNRYAHARWSTSEKRFIHFDGAHRTYSREAYPQRLQADLRKFDGKAARYQKVFRVDAPLNFDDWARLTVKFFEENELVSEYLECTMQSG